MRIRAHTGFDAEATLRVFLRAVRQIASRDYSPKQIAAWAPDGINLDAWTAKREAVNTVVATVDGRVIGFTDLDETGYIDMMFVDPDFTQRGVASALMTWIVEGAHECGIVELSSHVSLTARSFFEHNGFVVHEERHPILRGVEMTNFLMRRVLHSVPAPE